MAGTEQIMNPCPTPPVCEYGEYGCEAMVWWFNHETDWRGKCLRCGDTVETYGSRYCQLSNGGIHGVCGHRPLTELERLHGFVRGDRMGQRPEVDRVNVVPCDGTLTTDAILFGPIWILRSRLRNAGYNPDIVGREGAAFVQMLQRRHRRE